MIRDSLAGLFENQEHSVAPVPVAQKTQSPAARTDDKVQVMGVVSAMQAARHDNKIVQAASPPALAKKQGRGTRSSGTGKKVDRKRWATRLIGILVFVAAPFCNAQSSSHPTKSPKTVVEEFWKMDTEGGRLTDDGWRAADSFFARPIEPPKERVICVIYGDFAVRDPTVKDGTAEVIVGTAGRVW